MATINGTGGNDTLNGTTGDDELNGLAGDDELFGDIGNDTFYAGTGNDDVFGGAGNDTFQGQEGNDTLYGGSGADLFELSDAADDDEIFGGSAGTDSDLIRFISDLDVTVTFSGAEAGNYTQNAGNTTGTFTDIESIETAGGDDQINAALSTTSQTILSGAGSDSVIGGSGNDSILAGRGLDTIDAGAGDDQVSDEDATFAMSNTSSDTVFLGAGNDTFIGTGRGATDQDTIYGGAGNDTITVRQSFDTVFGGDGDDVISTTSEDPAFGDQLSGDAGNDTITGANTNDTLFGGDGNDVLVGNANNDTLFGGFGDDQLDGGDGNDTLVGNGGTDTIFGGAGDDVIEGGAGGSTFPGGGDFAPDGDTIYGGSGADTIGGGSGNDLIFGGDNDDRIKGDGGDDTLHGGAGNDTITAGGGENTIVSARYGGDDIITDFDIGDDDTDGFYNDQLDVSALRDLGGNPVNVGDVTVTDVGGFAQLSFPEGETILLQGVTPAQMSTNAQLHAAGIPCFTAKTRIRTPQGDIPIALLKVGDLVLTRDNGPQPILWIGTRHLGAADLAVAPKLRPVRIAPGAFQNIIPVLVSPQHGMLLDVDGEERLVRATHLARMSGGKVRQAQGVRRVTYVHLLFEAHQVIWGDGLPSESFYPGPCARDMLRPAQTAELCSLFPKLSCQTATIPRVRDVLRAKALPDHINALAPAL